MKYFVEIDIAESVEELVENGIRGIAFDSEYIIFDTFEEYVDFQARYVYNGGSGTIYTREEELALIANIAKEGSKLYTYKEYKIARASRPRKNNKEALQHLVKILNTMIADEYYKDMNEDELILKFI